MSDNSFHYFLLPSRFVVLALITYFALLLCFSFVIISFCAKYTNKNKSDIPMVSNLDTITAVAMVAASSLDRYSVFSTF